MCKQNAALLFNEGNLNHEVSHKSVDLVKKFSKTGSVNNRKETIYELQMIAQNEVLGLCRPYQLCGQ